MSDSPRKPRGTLTLDGVREPEEPAARTHHVGVPGPDTRFPTRGGAVVEFPAGVEIRATPEERRRYEAMKLPIVWED